MPDSMSLCARFFEPRSHRAVRRAPGDDQQIAVGSPAELLPDIPGDTFDFCWRIRTIFRGSLARSSRFGEHPASHPADAVLESGCAGMAHGAARVWGRAYREGIRPDRSELHLDSGDVVHLWNAPGFRPISKISILKNDKESCISRRCGWLDSNPEAIAGVDGAQYSMGASELRPNMLGEDPLARSLSEGPWKGRHAGCRRSPGAAPP